MKTDVSFNLLVSKTVSFVVHQILPQVMALLD